MLGRLLEISLHAPHTEASFDFYRRLGFAAGIAADMWPHAYGVVCSENLALGLHGRALRPLTLTFVQPDVTRLHRELEARGIPVESAVLGSDAFNHIELIDPAGIALRVIEARSFSAPAAMPEATLLGHFQRLSLPALHSTPLRDFWLNLGLDGNWPLAWHHPGLIPEPTLIFRHHDPASAADVLEARGFEPEERPLPEDPDSTLQLRTPENLLAVVLG